MGGTLTQVSIANQEATSRGPGRPRDKEIGRRVRAAAREEVADNGINDVTLASIARRAQIAKSTVYLRWPHVLDLLAEALVEVVDFGQVPDMGDLRRDLTVLAEQVVRVSMTSPMLELHLQFSAMGDRAPEVYRRFHDRDLPLGVSRGRVVFERARRRGEIREDLDLDDATAAFMGALLMNALIASLSKTPDARQQTSVVDLFVDGLVGPR